MSVNFVRDSIRVIIGAMEADEPDDLDRELQKVARDADRAHAKRIAAVRKALAAGRGPSRIARNVGWTREYIAKIRDGKTGHRTP